MVLIGGAATLTGVVLSNSRSRSAMKVRINELAIRVEKHNYLPEPTYRLKQDGPQSVAA